MDENWFDKLYPAVPHAKPPGEDLMLRLIAYDIADPKRLHRIAEMCEDFGVRVQHSLFECWLEEEQFKEFWSRLASLIHEDEDRVAAYTLDSSAARKRLVAGTTMRCTERPTCYIL
jgi:CRISPR-associated protein Cas2